MFRTNPKVPDTRVGERRVTKQLAGLVDGGFEEGQYEAALASLDQIRSPEYSPLPSVSYPPRFSFRVSIRKNLTSRVTGILGGIGGRIRPPVLGHAEPTSVRPLVLHWACRPSSGLLSPPRRERQGKTQALKGLRSYRMIFQTRSKQRRDTLHCPPSKP